MIEEGDLFGALLLSGWFLAVLTGAEIWARRGHPDPEWTRKAVHLLGGIGCLFFPWLIRSIWVVLFLATVLSAFFALGARFRFLQSLHHVSRRSRGCEYFPLAIFMTFVLCDGRPWLYLSSVLVLIVADAGAALIGIRFGRRKYAVEDSEKSLEGSLAFWFISFLALFLPLALLSEFPLEKILLASLLVSLLATGFEAITLSGTDNLFVPVAVCMILGKILGKENSEIIFQNACLLLFSLGIGVGSWKIRSFNTGAAIGLVLFVFASWSLGSPFWGLPILVGIVVFFGTILILHQALPDTPPIRVRVLTQALLPPLALMVFANTAGEYDRIYPAYLVALGAVLAIALCHLLSRIDGIPKKWRVLLPFAVSLLCWLLVGGLPRLFHPLAFDVKEALLAALLTMGGVWTAHRLDERQAAERPVPYWTSFDFLTVCIVSAVVFLAGSPGHF